MDDGCGGTFTCNCPVNNAMTGLPMPNQVCSPTGKMPVYGTCTCVPDDCVKLGVGRHANDGCGNPIKCGS